MDKTNNKESNAETDSDMSFSSRLKSAWSIKRNLRTIFVRDHDRWAFLDGYRALGIFWVILGHTIIATQGYFGMEEWSRLVAEAPFFLHWVFNGDVAVDGFLMLSGFLMGNILMKQYQERQNLNVKVFYISRFLRLTPAYFFALIVVSLVSDVSDKNNIANFFYLQNFVGSYDQYFLPYTWSIAVEEQFYLLLPAYLYFVLLKTDKPFTHLSIALMFSFIIRAAVILNDDFLSQASPKDVVFNLDNFGHHFVVLYDNLYTRFGAFIPGIMVAYAYRFRLEETKRFLETRLATYITIAAMAVPLGLFTFPILMEGIDPPQWFNIGLAIVKRNLVCIGSAWLVLCGLLNSKHAQRFNRFMSMKFFYPFGQLLYSMYLFHYIAVGLVLANLNLNLELLGINFLDHIEFWLFVGTALSIFFASIIATITYLLIEAPILNLRPKMSA